MDGTLIDSRADLTNAVNQALLAAGFPPKPQQEIVPHIGNGLRTLLSNVFGPVEDRLLDIGIRAFSDYYNDHCVDETVLYGGVKEGLEELMKSVKIGVVTNKPTSFSKRILDKLEVENTVSVLIGGDSTGEKKPHPAPVLKAMKHLAASAGSTLIVGDGHQDITAGKAAGIKTCAAAYGYGFQTGTLKLNPDFTIQSFNEIKEILL